MSQEASKKWRHNIRRMHPFAHLDDVEGVRDSPIHGASREATEEARPCLPFDDRVGHKETGEANHTPEVCGKHARPQLSHALSFHNACGALERIRECRVCLHPTLDNLDRADDGGVEGRGQLGGEDYLREAEIIAGLVGLADIVLGSSGDQPEGRADSAAAEYSNAS